MTTSAAYDLDTGRIQKCHPLAGGQLDWWLDQTCSDLPCEWDHMFKQFLFCSRLCLIYLTFKFNAKEIMYLIAVGIQPANRCIIELCFNSKIDTVPFWNRKWNHLLMLILQNTNVNILNILYFCKKWKSTKRLMSSIWSKQFNPSLLKRNLINTLRAHQIW